MIAVRGAGSAIAQSLAKLTPINPVPRNEKMPDDATRYLFCAGLLHQKPIEHQFDSEVADTFMVNTVSVMRECDRLIEINPRARICVIGSEAAYTWSFDGVYAAAKAALHRYVETKKLNSPDQQLVCVSPTIISDSGMTKARNAAGRAAMKERGLKHPKKRWLESIEVARMVHFLLCVDRGYTTGVIIRMNGGEL